MTTQAKHTSGPWTVGTADLEIHTADGKNIADAWRWNAEIDEPTAKANANLIAAAPDLLAALREMAEHWPPQKPESPAFMAYINAMSAIAKAEGRAGE